MHCSYTATIQTESLHARDAHLSWPLPHQGLADILEASVLRALPANEPSADGGVNVLDPPLPRADYAPWKGGSLLAVLDTREAWLTAQEWLDGGVPLLRRKPGDDDGGANGTAAGGGAPAFAAPPRPGPASRLFNYLLQQLD